MFGIIVFDVCHIYYMFLFLLDVHLSIRTLQTGAWFLILWKTFCILTHTFPNVAAQAGSSFSFLQKSR